MSQCKKNISTPKMVLYSFNTVLQPSFQLRSKVVHSGLKDESPHLKLIHSNQKL